MFKKGQVVAIQGKDEPLDFRILSQYQRVVRVVNGKYQLHEDADFNDPRLLWAEDELRLLTKEEIEGA